MHLGRWPEALQNLLAAGQECFTSAVALADDKVGAVLHCRTHKQHSLQAQCLMHCLWPCCRKTGVGYAPWHLLQSCDLRWAPFSACSHTSQHVLYGLGAQHSNNRQVAAGCGPGACPSTQALTAGCWQALLAPTACSTQQCCTPSCSLQPRSQPLSPAAALSACQPCMQGLLQVLMHAPSDQQPQPTTAHAGLQPGSPSLQLTTLSPIPCLALALTPDPCSI